MSLRSRNLIDDTYLFWSLALRSFMPIVYSLGVYVRATAVGIFFLSNPVLYPTTRTRRALAFRILSLELTSLASFTRMLLGLCKGMSFCQEQIPWTVD